MRLEVIGRCRFLADGAEVPLRSYGRILSALAFSPVPLPRAQLALQFESGDPAGARNRLRVALSTIKSRWPNLLLLTDDTVALNSSAVECDSWELALALDDADDTVSEVEELSFLHRAISSHDDWTNTIAMGDAALSFREKVAQACLRACRLADELADPALGVRAATVGTWLTPNDVTLWSAFLTLHHKLGMGEQAATDIQHRGGRAAKDPQVMAVLRQVRSASPRSSASGPEDHLILEVFHSIGESQPELCIKLLASPACLPLAGKFPREMHRLLANFTGKVTDHDEPWERCLARQTGLAAWLGDAEEVLRTAPELLASSKNPVILRATWNAVAVAHSLQRDWPATDLAMAKTLEFAKLTGDEIDVLATEGNAASFLMIRGDFAGAEALYDRFLARLKSIGTPRSEFEHAIGLGNRAFVPVLSGDLHRARQLLEEAVELRGKDGQQVQLGLLLVALAYVKVALGDASDVVRLVRRSFLDAFASGSVRYQQMTFEYAAALLAHTRERRAVVPVLDWVKVWRTKSGLPRGEAEEQFCEQAAKLAGRSNTPRIADDALPSEVGRSLMKRLRSAVEG